METLAIYLALNGVAVVVVSLLGGLFLYKAIVTDESVPEWHLLHAGGSARGILLIALSSIIHLPALPFLLVSLASWFIVFFVWTSVLAMLLRAITGEPGFHFSGSLSNKLAFLLYLLGTCTVFPGFLILGVGLLMALGK